MISARRAARSFAAILLQFAADETSTPRPVPRVEHIPGALEDPWAGWSAEALGAAIARDRAYVARRSARIRSLAA